MNREFWRERWEANQIGFHEAQPNRWLRRFGARLLRAGAQQSREPRVLVPLCGKATDLVWLSQHGFRVTGVELIERAVRAFFEENRLAAHSIHQGMHERLESDRIAIWIADFFELPGELLGTFNAIYDRAALVALPEDVRPRYARHLTSLLVPSGRLLLVTFHYDPVVMKGPPFSIGEAEVRRLFEGAGTLERLGDENVLDAEPRFKERGLTWLREQAWLFEKSA
jgi:thiopurine S-methyltransferase